jgi:hypothetical protein
VVGSQFFNSLEHLSGLELHPQPRLYTKRVERHMARQVHERFLNKYNGVVILAFWNPTMKIDVFAPSSPGARAGGILKTSLKLG